MFTFFKFHKIQSNNKLVTLIFLGWSWKNVFEACLYPTSSCQCMSVIAPKSNLSLFMFSLSQVLPQSIHCMKTTFPFCRSNRKCACYYQQNEHVKEVFSLHFLFAFTNVFDRSLEATTNHLRCQEEILYLHHLYLSNLFHTLPESGKCQHFCLNFSEHKTDGVRINNFAVLQLNY